MALIEGNHMVPVSTHSTAQIRLKLTMTCHITPESCFHKLCSKSAATVSVFSSFLLMYFQQDATLQSLLFSGKLLYMFRVISPPIIRSTHNCIYSILYLSNSYCYLPILWKSWNWFECDVGIV